MDYEKTLEFIGEVRAGISWERLSLLGTRHAEELIGLSNGSESARAFLGKRGIAEDYAIRNARDLLYRLHFNRFNDYYLALLLPRTASEEQINRRWKELMLMYHPDRNKDEDPVTYECATRVNEIYNILKDPQRRAEHDRSEPKSSMGMAGHPAVRRKPQAAATPEDAPWLSPGVRKNLARMIIPLTIAISCLFLMIVYLQNRPINTAGDHDRRSTVIEDRTRDGKGGIQTEQNAAYPQTPLRSQPPVKAPSTRSEPLAVTRKGPPEESLLTSPSAVRTPVQAHPIREQTEAAGKAPGGGIAPGDESRETTKESAAPSGPPSTDRKGRGAATEDVRIQNKIIEGGSAPAAPLPGDVTKGGSEVAPPTAPQLAAKRGEDIAQTSPETPPSPLYMPLSGVRETPKEGNLPKKAIESMVDRFVARYTWAYNTGNIDSFIGLYSRSAVENNTMNYSRIRRTYAKHFEGGKFSYVLKNYHYLQQGDDVILQGSYTVTKLSGDPPSLVLTGQITWKLRPEKDDLRIVRVDYTK